MPEWEVRLWATYFSREPGPDERLEYGIANLLSHYVNAHKARGKKSSKISDFLLFQNAWKYEPKSGDDDVDHDIKLLMSAFASRLVIKR